MADYIDRDELINKITKQPIHYIGGVKGYLEIKNIINGMPSVDAVEVVRCKDCVFNKDGLCDRLRREYQAAVYETVVGDDCYCCWGVKKNEIN